MHGTQIKQIISDKGLKQWRIAKMLRISEYTLCVWLREEVPEDRAKKILKAIDDLCELEIRTGGRANERNS